MSSVARIQHDGQVTIPTSLRNQAGLSKGDLVELSFHRGKIVLTPKDRSKPLDARDEYTPAQRRAINRGIAQSEREYKQGRFFGPFDSPEALIASLHKEAAKLRGKRPERAAK